MTTLSLRLGILPLVLASTLGAQQLQEQQHMNWGTIFDPSGALNVMPQAESNTFLRIQAGTGPFIPNEEFITLYSDDDAVAWGFDNGGTGDTVVNGIYMRIGDREVLTSHEIGILIRGEDTTPGNENQPDLVAPPIAAFVLGSFSNAAGGGAVIEYDLAFPAPVTIPAGTGSIFVGIELGRPNPAAPDIIETEMDELLPAELLTNGAPAGASQDTGSVGSSRGVYGHGLGNGGYAFVIDMSAGMNFFSESQMVATLTAQQPAFSLAATTSQATLVSSNPGGMPGHTTSFASGHQPQTIGRTDDVVFLMRDRDPQLQAAINPATAHFWTFFMSLASTPLPADLSLFFPGSVGAFCVDAGGSPPIEIGTTFNGGDTEGYFSFTFANAQLTGLAGAGLTASVQGLILDLDPMSAVPIRASGCSTVFFE